MVKRLFAGRTALLALLALVGIAGLLTILAGSSRVVGDDTPGRPGACAVDDSPTRIVGSAGYPDREKDAVGRGMGFGPVDRSPKPVDPLSSAEPRQD
jgi:hypothetical protein